MGHLIIDSMVAIHESAGLSRPLDEPFKKASSRGRMPPR